MKSIPKPRAFLFKVARNLFYDDYKKWKRRGGSHDSFEELGDSNPKLYTEHKTPPDERVELLALALENLPPSQQQLIKDHYYHGWTQVEIAERDGTTVQAVHGRLNRAKSRLLQESKKLEAKIKKNRVIAEKNKLKRR